MKTALTLRTLHDAASKFLGRSIIGSAIPNSSKAIGDLVAHIPRKTAEAVLKEAKAKGLYRKHPEIESGIAKQIFNEGFIRDAKFKNGEIQEARKFVRFWESTEEDLWSVVYSGQSSLKSRVECLAELFERADSANQKKPMVAVYVIEELEKCSSGQWRDSLIELVEQAQIVDQGLRIRLMNSIFSHALQLRDAGGGRLIWSAMRRYSTLIPEELVVNFNHFLREEDHYLTHQAALQCISTVFSVEPPMNTSAFSELSKSILRVGMMNIDQSVSDGTCQTAIRVLVGNAYRALAVLDASELSVLEQKVMQSNFPLKYLFEENGWNSLPTFLNAWEIKGTNPEAAERLRKRINRLNTFFTDGRNGLPSVSKG